MLTLPCVKQIAGGTLLYSEGGSAQSSVTTSRDGMRGGWEAQAGGDMCVC